MLARWLNARGLMYPAWPVLVTASVCGSAFAGWTAYNENPRLLGLGVWLLSLAVLVAAGFLHDRRSRLNDNGSRPIRPTRRWTRADWIGVAGLTLVAFGLRLYRLDNALPPFHGDEGEMGTLALLALHGPSSGPALLPFGAAFYGQPTLFHFLQAVGMQIFGESTNGLRMLSVCAGTLCVPAIYAVGRAGWGKMAGLTAGWLLATSQLHIHFSRIALNNIETVLAAIVMVALLLRLDRESDRKARIDAVGSAASFKDPLLLPIAIGLSIGLAQYFYFGSRLLPITALVLLTVLWSRRMVTSRQLGFLALGFAVAILPLAVFYIGHWPAFSERMAGVSIFSRLGIAHALGADARWPDDLGWLLWAQLTRNVLFFLGRGDHSAFYSPEMPSFDPVTIALFWPGLALMIVRASRFPEMVVLVWLGLGVLLGGVITSDSPNVPRLIIIIPAVCLTGGVFVQKIANAIVPWGKRIARWGVVPGAAIAGATFSLNASDYFVRYPQVYPAPYHTRIAEAVAAGAQTDRFFLMGLPVLYAGHGSIRFIARGAEISDLTEPDRLGEELVRRSDCKRTTIIAVSQRLENLANIEKLYPGGVEVVHRDRDGAILFATYRLPDTGMARPGCADAAPG
ncbi:MAG: phospholipid carrier-dependent glycosyltransferase [Rhizobiaceae bacterium]